MYTFDFFSSDFNDCYPDNVILVMQLFELIAI